MLKQSSSKMKKVLVISLTALFRISFTSMAAGGGGGHGEEGSYGGYGGEGGYSNVDYGSSDVNG
jgi:hypothetical protein